MHGAAIYTGALVKAGRGDIFDLTLNLQFNLRNTGSHWLFSTRVVNSVLIPKLAYSAALNWCHRGRSRALAEVSEIWY